MTDSTPVETAAGRLRGAVSVDGVAFRGIPYATARRFAPPAPFPPWRGIREAVEPGPAAPQPLRPVASFTHGALRETSEECLNLNVFTPSLTGARPVFVWLHGGGFTVGHASASLYEGARLALSADVVVVTVNYRLGSLGWLSHPGLAASPGAPSGNWGLLDQISALEWVRENISGFGGDPHHVTLAGQSAGALCAMDLLVSPGASGLFHRAILQSPPLADLAQPPEAGARWAVALSTGAGGSGELDAHRLKELAAERIVALHEELLEAAAFRGTRGGALPTVDRATLPESPATAVGASPDIDVLIGATAQEGTFFFNSPWRPSPPPERIAAIVSHLCQGDDPDTVLARYRQAAVVRHRPTDELSLLVDVATDAMVAGPVARWASARAAALAPGPARVYRYRVEHPGAGLVLGATHTVEVPLLFGSWHDGAAGERLGGQGGPATAMAAQALVAAWRRFAHGGLPGWNPVPVPPAESEIGVFGGDRAFSIDVAPVASPQA